jgi:hypothetical protein
MNRRNFLLAIPLAALAAKLKPLWVEEGHRLSPTSFTLDGAGVLGAFVMSDGEGEIWWATFHDDTAILYGKVRKTGQISLRR